MSICCPYRCASRILRELRRETALEENANMQLIRPGGLIAIDNVLWGGSVADAADNDAGTVVIRALNDRIHTDSRVEVSLVPIADGLTLARKN